MNVPWRPENGMAFGSQNDTAGALRNDRAAQEIVWWLLFGGGEREGDKALQMVRLCQLVEFG